MDNFSVHTLFRAIQWRYSNFSKSKIWLKIEKIKISKTNYGMKYLPAIQTCIRKICMNRSITLTYTHSRIAKSDRHTDRHTDGQTDKIFIADSYTQRSKMLRKKSFSLIGKKSPHRPNSNICPWRSLCTYKKNKSGLRSYLVTTWTDNRQTDDGGQTKNIRSQTQKFFAVGFEFWGSKMYRKKVSAQSKGGNLCNVCPSELMPYNIK